MPPGGTFTKNQSDNKTDKQFSFSDLVANVSRSVVVLCFAVRPFGGMFEAENTSRSEGPGEGQYCVSLGVNRKEEDGSLCEC